MKIAVVGSINMDITVSTKRIPRKGETLTGTGVQYIPGGKGANQAVAMSRLGAEVEMFGCVGDDQSGQALIDNLKDNGVGTGYIRTVEDTPTGIALITVGENDNTIIVVAGANGEVNQTYLDTILTKLQSFDMVVLQHEIPVTSVETVIEYCSEKKIPVVLNPAPAIPLSHEVIEKVTYLTPNEHEAKILFGESSEALLRRYPEKLLITLGSEGVITCLKSGELLKVPARPAKVIDTTGAGDTLNGAFAVKMAGGAAIRDALIYANTAASLSTEKFGAQGGMPSHEEVIKELEGE